MTGPFAGPNIDDTHPKHIQPVAVDFPHLKIVCGHACWPYASEMLGIAYRHENVFVSPDAYIFMPGGELFVQAAKGFLQDQLLYGSAYSLRELDKCLDAYLALGLPDKILEKTLGLNAARVLKIEINATAFRTKPVVGAGR